MAVVSFTSHQLMMVAVVVEPTLQFEPWAPRAPETAEPPKSLSLSLSRSLSLSLSLSISLSLSLSLVPSLLSPLPPIHPPSIHPSIHLSSNPPIFLTPSLLHFLSLLAHGILRVLICQYNPHTPPVLSACGGFYACWCINVVQRDTSASVWRWRSAEAVAT